ncbi:hypothetical protein V8E51_015929 [Hyaloscypha variabilis]
MPSEVLGKRSNAAINIDSDIEIPLAKVSRRREHVPQEFDHVAVALVNITKQLQDPQTQGILYYSLSRQSGFRTQITTFHDAIQKVIHDATTFNASRTLKNVKHQLDSDNYHFFNSFTEMLQARGAAHDIIKNVEDDIMSKIHPECCSEIKLGAVSALSIIIRSIVVMERGGEWASEFQDGRLPEVLISALMKVGESLSDSDIDRIREDRRLFARLELAVEFKLQESGKRPFKDLEEFQALCMDGSTVLDFRGCHLSVTCAFHEEPLTRDQLGTERDGRGVQELRDAAPRTVIERIITKDIAWKINRRSCFGTKLNAFKILTKIGYDFVRARRGPHAEVFADGVLEKTLTDTMLKICRLTNHGSDDSVEVGSSFRTDKELMEDIMDLNIARKAALPDLSSVLRYLDIPDKVAHSKGRP